MHIIYYHMPMKSDVSTPLNKESLEELLFHSLRAVYLFERSEVDTFGLDYRQMFLLKLLKRQTMLRVRDIAEALRIPAFSATRLVGHLESKHLIARARDNVDRRNIYISITPDGTDMVRRIEEHAIDLITRNLAGFGEQSVTAIIEMVKHLDTILGVSP